MNDYKVLLKNKNFLYIWFSQILSQLTINIMNFLLLLKIFQETQSTIATSFIWIVSALPAILIGPIGSAAVDMMNRKKVLMSTNLLNAFVILIYTLFHRSSTFLPYGIALAYSTVNQFYIPAELATLPSVISSAQLPLANGLFFITQQAALMIGFSLAGVFLNTIGFATSIIICAILPFIAFISVSFLPSLASKAKLPKDFEDTVGAFFVHIAEGYHFIKNNKKVLGPFALMIILQITLAVVAVNAPILAVQLFLINANFAGLLLVLPAGIGAFISSTAVPRLMKQGVRKKVIVNKAIMGICLVLILLTFLIPQLPGISRYIVGVVLLIILGLSFVSVLIPTQTYLQEQTPEDLRGRVFGDMWFLSTILTLFPVLISGAFTEILGARFITFSIMIFFLIILIVIKHKEKQFFSSKA